MAGLKSRDPRVDAYIANAQPFAQPILIHLRDLMHREVPGVEEAIKWGMPFFTLGGRSLANMAAFKGHAAFGFWRHAEVTGTPEREGAMGSLGKLTAIEDLPGDDMLAPLIAKAVALAAACKASRPVPKLKAVLDTPGDLAIALKAHAAAQAQWGAFSPGKRRDYIEWVLEAKREETRTKRIDTIVAQVAEGKDRNWKYKGC